MFYDEPATPRQKEALYGILDPNNWPEVPRVTKRVAGRVIGEHARGWRNDPATDKQMRLLASRNLYRPGMRKGEASDLIGRMLAKEKKMTRDEYESYRACQTGPWPVPPEAAGAESPAERRAR